MLGRAGAMTLAALCLSTPGAWAQEPGKRCQEPVIRFEVKPRTPAGFVRFHELALDTRGSYVPGNPDIRQPVHGFIVDRPYQPNYEVSGVYFFQPMRTGRMTFGAAYGRCDGSTGVEWRTVDVAARRPWTAIPWTRRRYGGPFPIPMRGSATVDDQQPTGRVAKRGISVHAECPRQCVVDAALQITRHRARRLGFRARGTRVRLASGSVGEPALQHGFVVKPSRRVIRRLRGRRLVRARLLIVLRGLNGATHEIYAPINLYRGARPPTWRHNG